MLIAVLFYQYMGYTVNALSRAGPDALAGQGMGSLNKLNQLIVYVIMGTGNIGHVVGLIN